MPLMLENPLKYLVCAAGLLWVGLALAQAPPGRPNPFPCESIAGSQGFDFWVGEWEVATADGAVVGNNFITKEPGGCVLVERWTSLGQSSGISLNFFDPTTSSWRQVWVGSGGSLIDIVGGLEEEDMVLEGTITYAASQITARFRGRWSPLADGRVRQYFEQFNTQADAWQPWFEGFYRRTTSDS
jgi:hypothetical protein